ncbi:sarcosine oxidase subunit gamma [Brevibacterium yomogidense]|uniref:sarcosine oxidase subunit gamma n=1 Tax=Brevibacterium yomogidense TaxID=946573 RepID=UPI0018DF45A4|nr:sarcosine oxidase subunit gamma family protein [Brevibacterium yomogidense]
MADTTHTLESEGVGSQGVGAHQAGSQGAGVHGTVTTSPRSGAAAPASGASFPGPRPNPTSLLRSPAQSLAADMAAASSEGPDGVSLREIPFALQLGIRAHQGGAAADRITQVLGVALPDSAGRTTGDPDGAHCVWLSPDEFLLVDVSRTHEPGVADAAAAALDDDRPGAGRAPGQVLDLSGNRTVLELSGEPARAVLEKGCHVDLHPRAFPVGAAVSTLVGPVQMIVHRAHEDTFRLLPRSSFAEYTVRWLLDAMLEFRDPR